MKSKYIKQKKEEKTRNTFFEKKINKDGTMNQKYIDLLEVDKPISGQAYGCFSFISPDKIIKQKEIFFFEQFIKQWDINTSMKKFTEFINFISYKYNFSFENLYKDFEDFVKQEQENITQTCLEDDYKTFIDKNEEELENKFNKEHKFQTSVRGFKSRGNFATQEEAEHRAKLLRELDPSFDIFVGPVGTWLCWDPEAYKTGNVQYLEEELNQLVTEKNKNEIAAKNTFDNRVKEAKKKAIEDNKINSEKYHSSITQDIDKQGNLFNIKTKKNEQDIINNKNTPNKQNTSNDTQEIDNMDDIRKQLFGENIVIQKNN